MDEIKPWYTSKTVWASFVGALTTFLMLFGINIGDLAPGLTDQILGIVTLISTVVAIITRITATKQLVSGGDAGPKLRSLLVAALLPALAFGGLATGVVALQSCASVQPGNDVVLVNAQRTATTSHQTFDLLFKVERENDAYVRKYVPAVHDAVNAIRRQAPKAEDNLWAAIETYRTNRTVANKADLNTYLATLQKLLDQAAEYTQTIQSKTAP